ncbi:hypothetical protein BS47DRAFT_1402267 [Hydnum rufescens UP504]|uniref:Uncharacterized protein n=1 Tax=Hydnum rufescens UP504 TaxID=1448309 RepID=A0A9P6ADJ2_9AGAM|nr:hypothetical protein BS47DRAFT_1402267 [Hydnum rufescens UP504]
MASSSSSQKRKGSDTPSSYSVMEDGVLHTYHFIPSPKRRKRRAVGTVYKGVKLRAVAYGGVRTIIPNPQTPTKKQNQGKTVLSPGHHSPLGHPSLSQALAASNEWEDDEEEADNLEGNLGGGSWWILVGSRIRPFLDLQNGRPSLQNGGSIYCPHWSCRSCNGASRHVMGAWRVPQQLLRTVFVARQLVVWQ